MFLIFFIAIIASLWSDLIECFWYFHCNYCIGLQGSRILLFSSLLLQHTPAILKVWKKLKRRSPPRISKLRGFRDYLGFLGQSEPAPHQCTNPDGALMDFTFSSHALTANQAGSHQCWTGITFSDTHRNRISQRIHTRVCVSVFNGWTIGAGYHIFFEIRFSQIWEQLGIASCFSPTGCDLWFTTCAKRQIEFSFFPIEKSDLT